MFGKALGSFGGGQLKRPNVVGDRGGTGRPVEEEEIHTDKDKNGMESRSECTTKRNKTIQGKNVKSTGKSRSNVM